MNYRMNLNDAALVKDKHVAAAGGVVEAFALVRHYVHEVPIEIEVDSIAQLRVAITAGADFLLLDNFAVDELRRAVDVVRDHERVTGHPVKLRRVGPHVGGRPRVAATGVQASRWAP